MAKIMIADDHANIRFLLGEVVKNAGHQVIASSDNGMDALTAYLEHIPDLVIMDQHLPLLSGLAVAQLILETHRSAKIILCTAGYEAANHQAKSLGIAIVPKPFEIDQILNSIDSCLRSESVG